MRDGDSRKVVVKDGEAAGRHCVILDDLVQVLRLYLPYISLISPIYLDDLVQVPRLRARARVTLSLTLTLQP